MRKGGIALPSGASVLAVVAITALVLTGLVAFQTPVRADTRTPTPATNIEANNITPVAVDSAGNIYAVEEEDYYVYVYDASDNYSLDYTIELEEDYTYYAALDSNDNLYVANYYEGVVVYSAGTSTVLRTISVDDLGDVYPMGLTIDSSDNLYIGDYESDTVTVVASGQTTPARTFPAGMDEVSGMAVDSNDNLYVSGWSGNDVEVYSAGTDTLLRTFSFESSIYGIAIDSADRVYVSDYLGDQVGVFGANSTTLEQRIDMPGVGPAGLAFNPSGQLVVGAYKEDKVQIYEVQDPLPISPDPHDFGVQALSSTSSNQTITVTNNSATDLVFGAGAVSLTGTDSGQFAIATDNCSSQTVAQDGTCTVAVNFTPTTPGAKTANLQFTNDRDTSPQVSVLNGTGAGVGFSPDSASHDFTGLSVGETSPWFRFRITNDGSTDLTLADGAVTLTGADTDQFAIASNTCNNRTVSAGNQCTVYVTFTPTSTGAKSASLQFVDNATDSPQVLPLSGYGGASFISQWQTTSVDESVTLPLYDGGTYNFDVDWGDGQTGTVTTYDDADRSHTYATTGTHTVTITGTLTGWRFADAGSKSNITGISQWGTFNPGGDQAFEGANNLTITATDQPDLTGVTSLAGMFKGATSLTGNLTSWNAATVTDFSEMFSGATEFNGSLASWTINTSAAVDMSSMFLNATAFNGSLSGWDVSEVTNMANMFQGAAVFNQDITGWDTAEVTSMTYMFSGATAFNQDISTSGDVWNTANVTTFHHMFSGATAFNGDVSGWDSGEVTNMAYMFKNCPAFNQDIGSWDMTKNTTVRQMFQGATAFDQDIGDWNVGTKPVNDFRNMFTNAGLSYNNYDALLVGWNAENLSPSESVDFGSSEYSPTGTAARTNMVLATGSGGDGWSITDGGGVAGSPGGEETTDDVLAWTAPTSVEAVTDYVVVYRPSGSGNWGVYGLGSTDTDIKLDATPGNCQATNTANGWTSCPLKYGAMQNGTDYQLKVFARSSAGFGLYSSSVVYDPGDVAPSSIDWPEEEQEVPDETPAPQEPAPRKAIDEKSSVVKVKAIKNNRLRVNVNPNRKYQNYVVKVKKKTKRGWKSYRVVTTQGKKDTKRVSVKPGKYRAVVPAQFGQSRAKSPTIRVNK